jgi:glycosyltransferase involved in cell wall biosynthesis
MILVQHRAQKELAEGLGLKSMLFPNIVNSDVNQIEKKTERHNVLIVGAITSRKSLHLLLPVIKKLKNTTFEFIGAPGDARGMDIQKELRACSNVVLHGRLDRIQTLEKVAGAKILLNTSQMEGFPNAFLEAWALGTPVISLFVDPGDVIKTHRLGYVCDGDVNVLENLILREKYDVKEDDLRHYVENHHSPKNAIDVFEILLSEDSIK